MSFSHNKYRQKDYRQRDRQFQYHQHNSYNQNRRFARPERHHNDVRSKPQYHAKQVAYYPHDYEQHNTYNHNNNHNHNYSRAEQDYYYDEQDYYYNNNNCSGELDTGSTIPSRDHQYEDDYCYDEESDDFSIPPLSPLSLSKDESLVSGQRYIRKNSDLHTIYMFQTHQSKVADKINTLDMKAHEAKLVNNWSKRALLASAIEEAYKEFKRPVSVLEIVSIHGTHSASCVPKRQATRVSFVRRVAVRDVLCGKHVVAPFDVVSVELSAMHEAFESAQSLQWFLLQMKRCTQSGARLVFTVVSDDVILQRFDTLRSSNSILNIMSDSSSDDGEDEMLWQNRYQSISMKKKHFDALKRKTKDDEFVGVPYVYYQMHAVDNVKEYFVCFEYLRQALEAHCGFALLARQSAVELCQDVDKRTPINGKMLPPADTWTKDERQVIETYAYALFRRQ